MRIARPLPTTCAAMLLALTACEVREDADKIPAGDSAEVAEAPPVPAETETPVASIIREDASPGPIMELPPEPLRQIVPFGGGGTDLSERAERILAGILESDAIDENWPIVLRGHTDSAGNDRANLRASRARAEAVAAWLVDRGVDDERIEVIAMGEQNPVAPNALPDGSPNEQGRARNRRVEVVIAPPEAENATGDAAEGGEGNSPAADETA